MEKLPRDVLIYMALSMDIYMKYFLYAKLLKRLMKNYAKNLAFGRKS